MKPKISKAELTDMEAVLQLQYAAYQSEAEINNDYAIQPLTQHWTSLLRNTIRALS